MKKNRIFSIKETLLIVIIILLIVGAGFFVFLIKSDSSNTKSSDIDQKKSASSQDSKQGSTEQTKTIYTNYEGKKLSVLHPSNWEVNNYESDEGPGGEKRPITSIKSSQGNYLHFWDPSGLGGDCGGPNNITYTLVKRIPTKIENVFFSEYKIDDANFPVDNFSAEQYDSYIPEAHKLLKEGQSNTDTCSNPVGYYSSVNGIYLSINKDSKPNISSDVRYDSLKSDSEFIDMLGTLSNE